MRLRNGRDPIPALHDVNSTENTIKFAPIRRPGIAGAMLACLLAFPSAASAYLSDRGIYPPINYALEVPPGAGERYLDPAFGTAVKRVSSTRETANAADTGNLGFITHEYATMSPFNADNSRMLVLHLSYFALYDGDGNYLEDLPFEITAASEPRWSRTDSDVLYYINANQLKRYDIASRQASLVRTFHEYSEISGAGESDISFDGDHLVLVGDRTEIFVYTLSSDNKGPVLNTTGTAGFDNVYITPDNNVLVGWYESGTQRGNGIELFDQEMRFLRQVTTTLGHMDLTRDVNGGEVLLWINAARPNPPEDCQNAVVKISLADGERTCLITFDWRLAMHVSAAETSPSFVVSTYAPADPAPVPAPAGGWATYTNEILQVSLDGQQVKRLAHHRSRPRNDYFYTPRAATSRDGSKVLFSSNFGLQDVLGYEDYYSDVYLIDVPSGPPSSAGSSLQAAARFEQDDPAVEYSGIWYGNSQPVHSAQTAALATGSGDRIDFSFSGTGVRWIGYRDPWSGIARVYVDGNFYQEVDTYAAETSPQSVLFEADDLEAGAHTLTVEAAGLSSPASEGAWVWVDAFEAVSRTEETAPAITRMGNWHTLSHYSLSGGGVTLSTDPGDRLEFQFDGEQVSWIGYRDRWTGVANVYVDGEFRGAIDGYAQIDHAQARMYTLSGLGPGPHTLTIEVAGKKHPLSQGHWVWVDAFDTLP